MKKMISTLVCSFFALFLNAQISLNKAYTPQNGNYYFELSNNSTTAINLGCYSLVSYYKTASERGFYVVNLPSQ